jgi:hypothetical protein
MTLNTCLRSAALVAAALVSSMGSAHAITAPATQSFDVFARANSLATSTQDASPLDTGITFAVGDTLRITASGVWNGGACGDLGPDGGNCFGNGLPDINFYSLIGRVGGGNFFKIGSSYDGIADANGTLFLAYLDTDSLNNSGFVTAVVSVPVPEPETYALMLGGLGILGMVARRRVGTKA